MASCPTSPFSAMARPRLLRVSGVKNHRFVYGINTVGPFIASGVFHIHSWGHGHDWQAWNQKGTMASCPTSPFSAMAILRLLRVSGQKNHEFVYGTKPVGPSITSGVFHIHSWGHGHDWQAWNQNGIVDSCPTSPFSAMTTLRLLRVSGVKNHGFVYGTKSVDPFSTSKVFHIHSWGHGHDCDKPGTRMRRWLHVQQWIWNTPGIMKQTWCHT